MMYRVLGQPRLGRVHELTLPKGHTLGVLAILMMNPNKPISGEELRRKVWPGTDVNPVQLYKAIAAIRKVLTSADRADDLVTHGGYGYELRVSAADHDLLQFQQLLAEADLPDQRGTEGEITLIRAALDLWRDDRPLAGVPGDFVEAMGADHRFRRVRALIRLCELEFARGGHAEVVNDLRTLFGYHPTSARLATHLMIALYRIGHTVEALSVYEQHAAALEDDSAAEPEAPVRTLKFAIVTANEATIAQVENAGPTKRRDAVRTLAVPRQLPPDAPVFVGRAGDLEAACRLLRTDGRATPAVVVVTGPGGIGKSAFATHVAHLIRAEYPDGQLYLDLAGTTAEAVAPAEAIAQILRAFDVKVPDELDERTSAYRTLFGDKRILLVLEDVRDEAQVRNLIPGNPDCAVVLTSRSRLPDLPGARHVTPLDPLAPADAEDLYAAILRADGLDPTAEPDATREIVELCAGLPLAIRVTGALRCSTGARGGPELLRRLRAQRLPALVYGDRNVARSIGAGLEQLPAPARRLFFGLGMLGWHDTSLWIAEAVLDEPGTDAYEALMTLVRYYLINPSAEGRYRFHDLTREYAAWQARTQLADGEELLDRVYGTLLTLVRRANRDLYGGDYETVHADLPDLPLPAATAADRSPMQWFQAERRNLRAAIRLAADRGRVALAWDLAVSTHEFYNLRGYLEDWQETHLHVLDACRKVGDRRGEAAVLTVLGQPAITASRRPGVSDVADLERAVALFEAEKDEHGLAIARRTLGNALRRDGDFPRAADELRAASQGFEICGDAVGQWQALRCIGQTHLDLNEHQDAVRDLTRAAELAAHIRLPRLIGQSAYWLGRAHLRAGDLSQARDQFAIVLAAVGETDPIGRAYAYLGLGEVAAADPNSANEADQYLREALELAEQGGDAVIEGRVRHAIALRHRASHEDGAAMASFERAIACFRDAHAHYLEERAQSDRDAGGH